MEIDALRAAQWQTMAAQSPASADRSAQPPDVVQAVKAVNESALFGQQYELTFNMDPNSHRALLRLVDRNTKEVIRQIPPDYVLRLARDVARKRTTG